MILVYIIKLMDKHYPNHLINLILISAIFTYFDAFDAKKMIFKGTGCIDLRNYIYNILYI